MIFANALESIKKLVTKEEESQNLNQEKNMTTARSNPFDDINGLVAALENAPQDKEGAFRVATWLMVLKEMQRIAIQLGETERVTSTIKDAVESAETPTVQQITETVNAEIQKAKEQLQSDLTDQDPDVILF
jgi:hypothetical protein